MITRRYIELGKILDEQLRKQQHETGVSQPSTKGVWERAFIRAGISCWEIDAWFDEKDYQESNEVK